MLRRLLCLMGMHRWEAVSTGRPGSYGCRRCGQGKIVWMEAIKGGSSSHDAEWVVREVAEGAPWGALAVWELA